MSISLIKHFAIIKNNKPRYLCNQDCSVTEEKIAKDIKDVTCKNCLKILNQPMNKSNETKKQI